MNTKELCNYYRSRFSKDIKSLVLGDIVLDIYLNGSITRLNPEAACPLVSLSDDNKSVEELGAAYNVARVISSTVGACDLASIIGPNVDPSLMRDGVHYKGIYSENILTPTKTRLIVSGSNILRMDNDHKPNLKDLAISQQKLSEVATEGSYDLVAYSDYDKMVFFNSGLNFLKQIPAKISVVDPKKAPLDRWRDCTVFKPNKNEALILTGKTNVKDAAVRLKEKLNCKYVVITLTEEGALAYDGESLELIPNPHTVTPACVSGAGDIFTSIVGVSLASGFGIEEAVKCALAFCTLFVGVGKKEFFSFLNTPASKVCKAEDLLTRDYKLVWTNGCFDILHHGHVDYLTKAAALGDKLVVGINSDESIRRIKGESRPVNSLEDRIAVLSSLSVVDHVVPFDSDTPYDLIKTIKPDVIVKGSDWKYKGIVGAEFSKEQVFIDLLPGRSTTNLIEKITEEMQE